MSKKSGRNMSRDVHEFLILGYQKVLQHYGCLLRSPGLPEELRRVIVSRLEEHQREFQEFIDVSHSDRLAS